jgi:hypothetical protein
MAAASRAIRARDMVRLITAVGRWPAGTTGTVVSDYGDVKLVEIDHGAGAALTYVSAPEPRLKLVDEDAGSTLP